MSTRALYSFSENENSKPNTILNIYKHHDGYPTGAADALHAALDFAWQLPRYEPDEFAAAFIAANKRSGGGLRVFPNGDPRKVAKRHCTDIEFRYDIYEDRGQVLVAAYTVSAWGKYHQTWLWTCPIKNILVHTRAIERAKEGEAL